MKWMQKTFDELSKEELYNLLRLRVSIFVVEQECPYPEIDGRDKDSLHIWIEENDEIVAYCRIVPPETEKEHYAIGRVLVVKEKRGDGYARQIVNRAIAILRDEMKVDHIWLHGQEHLRQFYGSFGFKEVSEVYLEDGIPHVDMLMKVE
ncbi:GNAT family N-acetyltransferase [Halobacillus mangrovi]|uniref:GNAT family N-acetyltransferase n=1 Tax=Halobacillus mangrovi TaxID=402384 RepID=A0A1W6A076_9BACI|nr:GNAT family N-acetyltransferase [Halobacillus mangrovi]ARI78897.1 GNAT family N-acetyltransferase [Halobacillus mangrovi]